MGDIIISTQYIIWGAKGHALVLDEIIRHQGCKVIALFDSSSSVNSVLEGIECHIGLAKFHSWCQKQKNIKNINAIAAIGGLSGRARLDYLEIFRKSGFQTPTLIHRRAVVSQTATIGENSHILAGAVVAPMAVLGEACIVNTNASVDHECLLDSGVHIAPGATLCGGVQVGKNSMVGAGSVVLPRVTIGKNVIVGAGSVVTKDIPNGVVVFGSPAKIIKYL
jgi:sugar O-acyltransferase (sialic acid O-acetyltransferase NeuD family)